MSPYVRRPLLAAAALVTVYALSTTSASAATRTSTLSSAAVPDGNAQAIMGTGCDVVDFYIVMNPSINKPRGHQDAPDHRSWAFGC
jgi:hypothetical protein